MRGAGDANAKKTQVFILLMAHERHLCSRLGHGCSCRLESGLLTRTLRLNLGQRAKLTPCNRFFRLTKGADAGKLPFDQVSLTLYYLLYHFFAVKLSFLFGNHFVVSMNWMSSLLQVHRLATTQRDWHPIEQEDQV